ncbi:MAG TPA: hypothetical protein PK765_00455 [bacterium]|nr:hypothetical protein [bacterium]
MRQARPFPDQATLADTLFVAPSGIGGPGLAERAKTQRDTAKPLPSGKQSAPSNQPKSPEQSSEAHSGKRFARTVSDAVNDGQITPEEAKNILARFEMESGNVSAAARKQWYALDLSVRKNLQSILQVNQDGGIARRGDGETIGAIRKIAES